MPYAHVIHTHRPPVSSDWMCVPLSSAFASLPPTSPVAAPTEGATAAGGSGGDSDDINSVSAGGASNVAEAEAVVVVMALTPFPS